jgi:hypothetical protein
MSAQLLRHPGTKQAIVSLLCLPSFVLAVWAALLSLPDSAVSATTITDRTPGQTVSTAISTTHGISGRVRYAHDPSHPGVEGATIYAGDHYSATTGSNGVYTITGVLSGTYTLSGVMEATGPCHFPQFMPPSRTVSVPPDAAGQDFSVAILIVDPGISGLVTDANGYAMAGVTVSATGLPAVITGVEGAFGWFPVECNHTYTVAPVKAGYTFTPTAVTFTTPESADLHFVGTDQFKHSFLPHIARSD